MKWLSRFCVLRMEVFELRAILSTHAYAPYLDSHTIPLLCSILLIFFVKDIIGLDAECMTLLHIWNPTPFFKFRMCGYS